MLALEILKGLASLSEQEEKKDQEAEPEHLEFRNPDGTFKPGHPYRWKKGQSGNPKGHVKGIPHYSKLSEIMKYLAKQPCSVKGYKGLTWGEAFCKTIFEHALSKGNAGLCKEIMDRTEGTVKQVHEVEAQAKTIIVFEKAEPPDPEQHKKNGANGKLNGLTRRDDS